MKATLVEKYSDIEMTALLCHWGGYLHMHFQRNLHKKFWEDAALLLINIEMNNICYQWLPAAERGGLSGQGEGIEGGEGKE